LENIGERVRRKLWEKFRETTKKIVKEKAHIPCQRKAMKVKTHSEALNPLIRVHNQFAKRGK